MMDIYSDITSLLQREETLRKGEIMKQTRSEELTPIYLHLTKKKKDTLKIISKEFHITQTALIEQAVDNIILEYGQKYNKVQYQMNKFMG